MEKSISFGSQCVHAGEASRVDGAAVFPVFQTATFATNSESLRPGSSYTNNRYTRCNNNPSQLAAAAKLAALEAAEDAVVTCSGMSAITTTLSTFLSAGDHIIVQPCLYGGTYSFVHETLKRMGVQISQLRMDDPTSWFSLIQPNTKIVYVETISNPTCEVPDLPAVVRLAQQAKALAIIDNTFASPANYRPIDHGFDLVIESCTKYLNGHSDVIVGCVAGRSSLVAKVREHLSQLGGAADPHACFLLQRGIKTLGLRVSRQNVNALALATALQAHPAVCRVHYPGLLTHPQHNVATRLFSVGSGSLTWTPGKAVVEAHRAVRKSIQSNSTQSQQDTDSFGWGLKSPPLQSYASVPVSHGDQASDQAGYGGVLSFELHGGYKAAEVFLNALKVATVAPSLGGIETLVIIPASSSHAGQTPEQRAAIGVTDGLIRVAVGIEDTKDLLADFVQAADMAQKAVA